MASRGTKPTRESSEAWIREVIAGESPSDLNSAISNATKDTDADVIADGLIWALQRRPYELASIRRVPARAMRALWQRLKSTPELGDPLSTKLAICLREMLDVNVSDEVLKRQWDKAVQMFDACDTSGEWGSRKSHARLAKLVAEHGCVAAAHALTRQKLEPVGPLMAILAIDASPISLSLLEQLVIEAIQRDERRELRYLQTLRVHATSDAALAVVGRIDAHLRTQSSIAEMILWFGTPSEDIDLSFVLVATPRPDKPRVSILVHVSNEHFTVALGEDETGRTTTIRKTSDDPVTFTAERDDFQLGACLPTELPAFLQHAAERLALEWDHDNCQLEAGTRRNAVARWLRTGQLPSRKSGMDPRYHS